MSEQVHETLCDFIRGIRSQADEMEKCLGDQHTFVETRRLLADRLDQIRMRMEIEQAKLRGESAALREALTELLDVLRRMGIDEHAVRCALGTDMCVFDKARNALSAPARNCDVGTASDQNRRYRKYCNSHFRQNNHGGSCECCPLYARKNTICQFAWAQMPYEAEGGAK